MDKPRMSYFEGSDILHMIIAEGTEASSVEISPNITAELDEEGRLLGVEILDASSFLRDSVLESVEAKILHLSGTAA